MLIEESKGLVKTGGYIGGKASVKMLNGFLYSNMITNTFNNLNEENIRDYNLNVDEVNQVKNNYDDLHEKAKKTLENPTFDGDLTKTDYERFKQDLKNNYSSIYQFLIELENYTSLSDCEKRVNDFDKSLESAEKPTFEIHLGSK